MLTTPLRRRTLLGAAAGAAGAALLGMGGTARADDPERYRWGTIGLVPLDDRPYTWYAPAQLATGAGYRTVLPPRDVLGRHFTPGDPDAISQWLTRHTDEVDALIVALPMLAYGGLLHSRDSAVPHDDALRTLDAVRAIRRRHPRKRLYGFDTIMRLTPEGPWRTQLRDWATLKDQVENLGMEDKRAEYEAVAAEIPAEVRADYLATRARNHDLNLTMIEWAADGVFDYLIMGQDDASGHGLHRPEAEALQRRIDDLGVGDRVVLYPGADTLAALFVAKIAIADAAVRPRVYVEYSRVHGDEWTAPFQNLRYAQVIDAYLTTIGGTVVPDRASADIILMANTGGSSVSVEPFATRVVEYLRDGHVVALGDDAIAGRSDPRLLPFLADRMRYAELAGYSGWNIGITIAQSTSRWALARRSERLAPLPDPTPMLLDAAQATVQLSVSEWIQTDSYRNHVRNDTTAYATELGEANPQIIEQHYEEINAYAVEHTLPFARTLFEEQFAGADLAIGHDERGPLRARVGRVSDWNLYLPWLRTGEIAAEPSISIQLIPRQ